MSNNVKILVLRRRGLHPNWAPVLFPFLGRTHISPMKRHMVLMGRVRMPIILPRRMLRLVARWFIIQQSQKSEDHGTNLTPKLCKRLFPTADRLESESHLLAYNGPLLIYLFGSCCIYFHCGVCSSVLCARTWCPARCLGWPFGMYQSVALLRCNEVKADQ